jgi:hypothetical protein
VLLVVFSSLVFVGPMCPISPRQNPNIPSTVSKKPAARVRAAGGGTTTSVTTACARGVREYIPHASLAGDVLAVGSVSQLG